MQQSHYFSHASKPPQRRAPVAIAKTRVLGRGGLRLEAPDGVLWLLLIVLLGMFCLASPARAADSPTQLEIPEPWVFLNPDSISFAVIRARQDDEGFKSLLDTAWKALKSSKSPATTGVMGILLRIIQGDDSNGLISFLPLQMVRVDSLDPETELPHPTLAVTVSGWGGLQTPLYAVMSRDKEGKPYPTQDLEDATLVLREGWKDPSRSHVLTRVKGTFVAFPTVQKAETAVKSMVAKNPARPKGELSDLLTSLDAGRDTYGVLLNRKGSLIKFLTWLNKGEVNRAIAVVGQERMDSVMSKVSSMTWEGELLSDNEMNFFIRFQTDSPEARKELAALMKEVREVLNGIGRAGEMKTTGIGSELHVDFTMTGYRDMVTNYISSSV
jgi:hypothetical protein